MAWFFGQSLVFVGLAFLLGLLVGWLTWGRTSAAAAPVTAVAQPVAVAEPVAQSESAADREPEPVTEAETVDVEPGAEAEVVAEPMAEVAAKPVVEAQPKPVAGPAASPVTPSIDNFQRLEGIGPKISTVLVAAGIRTYGQLAACDQDTLNKTLRAGGVRVAPSMSTWTTQAQLLAQGDEAGFSKLTRELVAGRRSR